MVWITAALVLALCTNIYLYFSAIKKMNGAVNFLLLVLQSEKTYKENRDWLIFVVSDVKANGPIQLSLKIAYVMRGVIFKFDGHKLFEEVTSRLWTLNQTMRR